MENDFEEALSNIDAFCRVLAKKIAENEEADLEPELIENLLRRKYVAEVYDGCLEWDRPLIDVF
ncbi:MAG: hypothetical protein QXU02_05085, partial [Candidatus Bathyarchaeia archaeon]